MPQIKFHGKMKVTVMETTEKIQMLNLQVEATQVGIYCEILKNILVKHRSLSIMKILAFSFVIKKNRYLQVCLYSAKNRSDLVLKFLSQATGRYDEFCIQLPYIFQAIDILVKKDVFEIYENELLCRLPANWDVESYGDFTNSAIEESQNYTDRQFLKEVISIV